MMYTCIVVFTQLIVSYLLYLFIKSYLPSYIEEKGKNLATKNDIRKITRKTEEVQEEFKKNFEFFASDLHFRYDFYYQQYSELYCDLYAIIIQSEYVRCFLKKSNGKEFSFEDAPFIEISPTKKTKQKMQLSKGNVSEINISDEYVETSLSEFNKINMCNLIIEKGAYSSQELIKLAISYRFAHEFYAGDASCAETANEEEFRLIRQLVCCIVKEYNCLRKELKMPYDEEELNTGIPHI